MAARVGNGSSEQVSQACEYLNGLLSQDTAKALSQNVKDKCAKLKQLVSHLGRQVGGGGGVDHRS